MKELIKLGDVVKVFDWTENKEGILAYVYLIEEVPAENEYTIYLLDCHGVNMGPYNPVMREFYVDRIGSSGFEYLFTSFLQVTEDAQNGVFDRLWKQYAPVDNEMQESLTGKAER
jgi:hypothetical protein